MIRLLTLTLSLLVSINICLANEQQKLANLLEQIWQYELSVQPMLATSQGIHDYDHQLADYSAPALQQQNSRFEAFLAELAALDATKLDRENQINLLMQQYRLNNYVDQYRYQAHFVPITSEYGFHSALLTLPKIAKLNTPKDVENYLQRLEQVARVVEQNIQWMRKGMEVGMVQPKAVLKGYDEQIKSTFSMPTEENPFYVPLTKLNTGGFSASQTKAFRERAKTIVESSVIPAYQSYYQFMRDEYIPQSKLDISALTWPNGKDYYQNRIQHYTTTDMTADEIHQTGLEEVKRIRDEMQQIIEAVNFDGDINAFIAFLRTDPQFYAKTADELIRHATYYSKRVDALLPKLFYKLPRTPYGVAPVPENIAPKYTTGRYIAPRRDDQPGYYWVNTYALDKRPLYAIPALTLHEAVPGHHLQISLAREMATLPPVRRYTYISAFGEGWGLYSEYLGKEVGFYKSEYEEFGRLSYEMWRACRLVVDTGMHVKGWSRQQALDYMMENTALSAHNVRTEIDRYISWPAQALSYKIGELEIKSLRRQAEKALGDKFDVRAFHDAVLAHGSVPLSVLQENIQQFIQENQ